MTRAEHLAWSKKRALEYVDRGDLAQALASMVSDMGKHDECGYPDFLNQLGLMEVMNSNRDGMRRWIEGFN